MHRDVVMVSDLRLPGGTTASMAEEIAIQARLGYSTGLISINSSLVRLDAPWNSRILDLMSPGVVDPIAPGEQCSADLVVIRHPGTIRAINPASVRVNAKHVIIVANNVPRAPGINGTVFYDPMEIDQRVREVFGVEPEWQPLGPVVRESLKEVSPSLALSERDWMNVFRTDQRLEPRQGLSGEKPVIGRHSRPQPAKWPDSPKAIRHAYPTDTEFKVKIMGGTQAPAKILGGVPSAWEQIPFDGMPVEDFLREVDFWVYFHSGSNREAYGRAIMEALASGCVVVLPEYLRETYGDAARYARPHEVKSLVRSYQNGIDNYSEQSERAVRFAQSHGPQTHVKRLESYVESDRVPSESPKATETHGMHASEFAYWDKKNSMRAAPSKSPRMLIVTSNGAGMGHLTRMLGVARSGAGRFHSMFFSMSQGVGVVEQFGFRYEYVPFRSALGCSPKDWNSYFGSRLREMINAVDPDALMFDGTWPYLGMLPILDEFPDMKRVWMRRAMWKPTVGPKQLQKAKSFDLVLEPGEYSHELDRGATTQVFNALGVSPITVLKPCESLSKQDARRELGLDPNGHYALVTLGAGNINDVAQMQSTVVEQINAKAGWETIVTSPPIANLDGLPGTRVLSYFPIARYAHAFDFAVSAAGYNSFSEWMSLGLPTLWIPNMNTATDDQDARAKWAEQEGVGLRYIEGQGEVGERLEVMMDCEMLTSFRQRMTELPPADGGQEAADAICALLGWNSIRRES